VKLIWKKAPTKGNQAALWRLLELLKRHRTPIAGQ